MRRILAGLAAVTLAVVALPAGPAAATSSASCSATTSVRLFTGPILGSPTNKVWVDHQSPTRLLVCVDLPFMNVGGLAVVADVAPGGTLPSVTLGIAPAACVFTIFSNAVVTLAVNLSTATVCLTVSTITVTVTVNPGGGFTPPTVEVWRDGTFGLVDIAACPVEYANWQFGTGPATCMTTNARIV